MGTLPVANGPVASEEDDEEHVEVCAEETAKSISRRAEKRRAKRRQHAKTQQDTLGAQQRKADEEFLRETMGVRQRDIASFVEMPGPPVKPARVRKPREMSNNALAQDLQVGLWGAKLG